MSACAVAVLRALFYLELIADAPNGFYGPVVFAGKLFTQTLDVHVYCAGVSVEIKLPYHLQQLFSCEHLVGVRCKEIEQLQFFWGQLKLISAIGYGIGG